MATLKIYDPQIKAAQATTPTTEALVLPLSLATEQGKAISAFGKTVGAIVNLLSDREDENQVNDILPKFLTEISSIYEKYSKTSDVVNSPVLFEKAINDLYLNKKK